MPRILVVDDEPLIAMMLADWVLELGHELVGPAGSEAIARQLLETGSPDAAILDVSLSGGNSFALARTCRERGLPFAFATGHGKGDLPADFAGAEVLAKPFRFDNIKQLLAKLLS